MESESTSVCSSLHCHVMSAGQNCVQPASSEAARRHERRDSQGCSARVCVPLPSRGAAAAGWFGRGTPSTASDSGASLVLHFAFPAGVQQPGWPSSTAVALRDVMPAQAAFTRHGSGGLRGSQPSRRCRWHPMRGQSQKAAARLLSPARVPIWCDLDQTLLPTRRRSCRRPSCGWRRPPGVVACLL